jgi:hypothetical protein
VPLIAKVWKFVFANQSPILAVFSPVKRLETWFEQPSLEEGAGEVRPMNKHEFSIDFVITQGSHTLPHVPMSEVQVISHVCFEREGLLTSMATPMGLEEFVARLPVESSAAGSRPCQDGDAAKRRLSRERDIRDFPWLAEVLCKPKKAGAAESMKPPGAAADDMEGDSSDDDDAVVTAIFDALGAKRAALADESELEFDNFRVTILGGQWTAKHKGVPFDAVQATARGDLPNAWSIKHGLNRSARFELALYGEAWAPVLARGWAHRMQFFYNLHVSSGTDDYRYTAVDAALYVEPAEFRRAADALDSAAASKRIAQIRGILQL